jgi:hypothetical protein
MCGRDPPCRGRNKNKVLVKPRPDCPRRLESKTANGISFQCCDASQPPSALRRARKRRSVQQALAAGACTHEPLRQ